MKLVTQTVRLPVIASVVRRNGAFYDAIVEGRADAVLVASLFHFREVEII